MEKTDNQNTGKPLKAEYSIFDGITLKLNYSHKNKEEWKQEFYSRLCCIFKVKNWVSWSVVLKQKAQI